MLSIRLFVYLCVWWETEMIQMKNLNQKTFAFSKCVYIYISLKFTISMVLWITCFNEVYEIHTVYGSNMSPVYTNNCVCELCVCVSVYGMPPFIIFKWKRFTYWNPKRKSVNISLSICLLSNWWNSYMNDISQLYFTW